MGNRADKLFTRFRTSGDPDDLTEVFDLCAYDLLKVAMHLCPTDGEAEDLVQETFLVAINSADRYRPGESVRAWLLGILRNLARDLRKRTGRRPDADRLATASSTSPGDTLMQEEFINAYEVALREIPLPYREVLDLRLRGELQAKEIAHRLKRSPGTVRTQIYRAMEMLRAALPGSAAIALTPHLSTRGMDSIRAKVVGQASVLTQAALIPAGLIALKKLGITAAAIFLATSAWYVTQQMDPMMAEPLKVETDLTPSTSHGEQLMGSLAQEPLRRSMEEEPEQQVAPMPSVESQGPILVDPYELTVLVLDTMHEPLMGTEVFVYDAQLVSSEVPQSEGLRGAGSSKPEPDEQDSQRAYSGRARGAKPFWSGWTDGSGRCTLRLDREYCMVTVEHELYGPSSDHGVARRLDGQVLRVVLEPCTRVTGAVRDGEGRLVPGAWVGAGNVGGRVGRGLGRSHSTRADDAGRYEFKLPAGHTYALMASHDDLHSRAIRVEALDEGGEREVDLVLPGGFRVLGMVLTPDGGAAPEGGVRILSALDNRPRRRVELEAERFGKGRFEAMLSAPGEFLVVAHAPGWGNSKPHRVALDPDHPMDDITLRLEPLVTLEGRVLDPGGEPCPGLDLQVNRQRINSTGWASDEEALHVRTDAVGGFVVEGVQSSSRYTFTFAPNPDQPDLLQRVRGIEGGRRDVELRLDPDLVKATSVSGRVLDGAGGAPVLSFEVSLMKVMPDGHSSRNPQSFTSEDGHFEISGLVRGQVYLLRIDTEGRQAVVCPEWTADGPHSVEIVLPEPASLECVVWTRDGVPAPEVTLSLMPQGEKRRLLGGVRATTDKLGVATLGVGPGDYKLHALVPSAMKPEAIEVELYAGGRQRVDVHLR